MMYITISAIIVDDDQDAGDILERQLLRLEGIEIIGKAKSVDEGFEMIIGKKPDIVFLDIQMPEKNGFELV